MVRESGQIDDAEGLRSCCQRCEATSGNIEIYWDISEETWTDLAPKDVSCQY